MTVPDDILYLVHATNIHPSTIKYLEPRPSCKEMNKDCQFPGVYCSLITKGNRLTQNIYPGKYVLVLSLNVLLQSNWHVNAKDHNGNITEHNTYFPWNYKTNIDKLSDANEVVFHDPINMRYLCRLLIRPSIYDDEQAFIHFITKGGIHSMLPQRRMHTRTPPDMTKKPFYVFNTEHRYTGTTDIPKSSMAWLRMMAKVAKILPIPIDRSVLVSMLQKHSLKLCFNREEQDLVPLKAWTTTR
jgi:hypothetical protein